VGEQKNRGGGCGSFSPSILGAGCPTRIKLTRRK